jgi:hypothetical protein
MNRRGFLGALGATVLAPGALVQPYAPPLFRPGEDVAGVHLRVYWLDGELVMHVDNGTDEKAKILVDVLGAGGERVYTWSANDRSYAPLAPISVHTIGSF